MPEELKHSRNFHEILRQHGIQNPGEVGIGTPIQLTQEVDDVSHLVRPIPVRVYGHTTVAAAGGAGVQSGISFQAGPGGAWILWLDEATSADRTMIIAGPTSDMTIGAAQTPNMLTGIDDGAAESRLHTATRVGLPANVFHLRNTIVMTGLPLYIQGGHFFEAMRNTANALVRLSLVWQEVPSRA